MGEKGEVVTFVDRNYIKSVNRKARQILVEQQGYFPGLDQFKEPMLVRFGYEISDVSLIKDLGRLLKVKIGLVGLFPLQRIGKQVEDVLGGQSLLRAELQRRHQAPFSHLDWPILKTPCWLCLVFSLCKAGLPGAVSS